MRDLNRRDWLALLAQAGLGAGAVSPGALWATPAAQQRFVLVMLRGAYDGLSAVWPYSDPFYFEARPRIAMAPAGASPESVGALRLDDRWALHPVLSDSAGDLFRAKQLAWVPFCGTSFVSRSHFQAQDWVECGKRPDQRPDVGDGFMNRLAQVLGGQAISFTQTIPVALNGPAHVVNAAVSQAGQRMASDAYLDKVMGLYAGHALAPLLTEGLSLRRALMTDVVMQEMQELQASGRTALSATGFALEAQRMARFMRQHAELSLAFMDVGGWDTHAGQGGAQGQLANRLAALGQGIELFAQELGGAWQNTVVVVMSEFGRTFHENGSGGTDHGHGNLMWIAGGAVAGGCVRGDQSPLVPGALHQGRDLPVLHDYRDVLAGLFQRMYGLRPAQLNQIFPGTRPNNLGAL